MGSNQVIISGTGRAGTTFLIQLLTCLGFDTGFANVEAAIDPNCNAGMEWDLRHPVLDALDSVSVNSGDPT